MCNFVWASERSMCFIRQWNPLTFFHYEPQTSIWQQIIVWIYPEKAGSTLNRSNWRILWIWRFKLWNRHDDGSFDCTSCSVFLLERSATITNFCHTFKHIEQKKNIAYRNRYKDRITTVAGFVCDIFTFYMCDNPFNYAIRWQTESVLLRHWRINSKNILSTWTAHTKYMAEMPRKKRTLHCDWKKSEQKLSVSISNWIYVGLKSFFFSLPLFLLSYCLSSHFDDGGMALHTKNMQWNSFRFGVWMST